MGSCKDTKTAVFEIQTLRPEVEFSCEEVYNILTGKK